MKHYWIHTQDMDQASERGQKAFVLMDEHNEALWNASKAHDLIKLILETLETSRTASERFDKCLEILK